MKIIAQVTPYCPKHFKNRPGTLRYVLIDDGTLRLQEFPETDPPVDVYGAIPCDNLEDPEMVAAALLRALPDDESVTDRVQGVVTMATEILTPVVTSALAGNPVVTYGLRALGAVTKVPCEGKVLHHTKEIRWTAEVGRYQFRVDYNLYTMRPWAYTVRLVGARDTLAQSMSQATLGGAVKAVRRILLDHANLYGFANTI